MTLYNVVGWLNALFGLWGRSVAARLIGIKTLKVVVADGKNQNPDAIWHLSAPYAYCAELKQTYIDFDNGSKKITFWQDKFIVLSEIFLRLLLALVAVIAAVGCLELSLHQIVLTAVCLVVMVIGLVQLFKVVELILEDLIKRRHLQTPSFNP